MEEIEMTEPATPGLNKKVLVIYTVFIIVMIIQVLPSMAMQIWSLITLGGLAAILKILRTDVEKDELVRNHATYLFRTLSFWTFLLFIATCFLSVYLSANYDYEQLMGIVTKLLDIVTNPASTSLTDQVLHHLAMVGLACFVPTMIYLALRTLRGLYYALKGQGLPKPKTLF